MPDTAPLERVLQEDVPANAAGADSTTPLGTAPFAGTVESVTYIATAALTGADTDSRTVNLVNRGQAGAGTTVIATVDFDAGSNAAANDETTIPLSAVAGATTVAAGDVLDWESVHVGSTGLADPGGLVVVTIARA